MAKPTQYKRGFTAKEGHPSDARAAKLKGMSYNDLYSRPRSVLMSPPTGDTQEPRGSGLRRGGKVPPKKGKR